jgi:aspartate-semialdehyde dehydrogenase
LKKYIVAVVGVTGAVGEEILRVLEEQEIPVGTLVPLASKSSAGKKIEFDEKEWEVQELTEDSFEKNGIEIALFSAGGSISAKYAPYAVEAGAVVIDNTSHFRMNKEVPLVVPEVNRDAIQYWKVSGIIANPNCSTIQMVQALKPLDNRYEIERVDVSTYQATSGAGKSAMEELGNQMKDFFDFKLDQSEHKAFPHQIAMNVIPQIDKFMESGYTKEEEKMIFESQKILQKEFQVSATCVRVPTFRGHAESVSVTFKSEVDVEEAREVLENSPNIIVIDEPNESNYPMPILSVEKDETFVGRIRKDLYNPNILHFWVVADNLRVGAATNAVRIAKEWIKMEEEN